MLLQFPARSLLIQAYVRYLNRTNLLEGSVFSPFCFTLDSPRSQSEFIKGLCYRKSETGLHYRLSMNTTMKHSLAAEGLPGLGHRCSSRLEMWLPLVSLDLFANLLSSNLPVSKCQGKIQGPAPLQSYQSSCEQEGNRRADIYLFFMLWGRCGDMLAVTLWVYIDTMLFRT